MTATKPMTADELWEMPDDGYKYELVRGVLVRMTPPGGDHGSLETEMVWLLRSYLAQHPIGVLFSGDTGFLLARNPDLVRGPDIAFVRAERLPPKEAREGFLPLAPDLAIEIVSPSDRAGASNEKVMDYLDAGTRLVWLIHPRRRTVTIYHADRTARVLREGDELDGSDALPGFRIPVSEIFEQQRGSP